MAREEKDGVEELKKNLYSRSPKKGVNNDVRTPLSLPDAHAPVSWAADTGEDGLPLQKKAPEIRPGGLMPIEEKPKMSAATIFFLSAVGFFVVAAVAAAAIFFGGQNLISPQNIDVEIAAPSLIDAGKEATFQVLIKNRNPAQLQLADLIFDYPQGTRDPKDANKPLPQERQSIGTIESGEQLKRTSAAIFYGAEGTPQTVSVRLQYSVAGSNAVFEKKAEVQFTIGSSPISLSVDAPSNIIAGQSFKTTVTVQSNAAVPVDNVVVQAQYPFGFAFQNSTPNGDTGGTFWRIGTLTPGSSKQIVINGSVDGQDGDSRIIRFLVGSSADQTESVIKVPFLTVPQTLTVERPLLQSTITINGQSGKNIAADAGKTVQGSVALTNNLNTAVSNVEVSLVLAGPVLDKNSIQSGTGFYQSQNSTITWTSSQEQSLVSVPPGATVQLSFTFATLPPGTGGTVYTNPTVTLNASVQGARQGTDNTAQQVTAAAQTQITLASAASLLAESVRLSSPANTGPVPPVAEQPTTYTIRWTVKNSSSALANASVYTTLPTYVQFIPSGSDMTYDATTRVVRWNMGDVKAGAGYSSAARVGSFQVSITPSTSQIGTVPALTGGTTLQGTDRFAQVQISATADGPTTATSDGAVGSVSAK